VADKLLTIAEVSIITRLPQGTLRYYRSLGKGPQSAKFGKRVVYRESDVEAWIAAQFRTASKTA